MRHVLDHATNKKLAQQRLIQKALDEQVQANQQKRLLMQAGITPTEYSLNKDRIRNLAATTTGLLNLTQENFVCIDPKTTRL